MQSNDDAVSIELIKKAFTSKHFPDLFAGESTHNAALALVAQLVPFTDDEQLIFEIVRSGLPENYDGDTLDEISSMVQGAIKKGFGDGNPIAAPDPSESMASQVVRLAMAKATDFFHDRNRRSYVSMLTDQGGVRTISLNSSAASEWLAALWYATARGALPSKSKADALATLQAHALFDGRQHPISHRVARTADAIYVDLGGPDYAVVRIDSSGWEVTQSHPIKFVRSSSFAELPQPSRGGDLRKLQRLLQLSDAAWSLVLAFVISSARPAGPYFCLLVDGEQGSGKSLLCSLLKRIIDPSLIDKLPLPDSDEQLFIQAKDSHLLVFDKHRE